jgi:spore germination cell wall hydrolase CwlJ-like protein
MDSPLPFDQELLSEEPGERGRRVAARLLRASEHAPEAPYIRKRHRKKPLAGPIRRRRNGWIATALLGAGVLLVYGSSQITIRNPVSIAGKLPDATAAGTVVVNLPPPNLLKPISPEEAVKENAERPFVSRPDSAAGKFVLRTGAEDRERALTCLTQAIYYEAASEGADGGRAVAQVVLNRMRHPGYPSSVCGVIYQGSDRTTGCQFTFTCDGSLLRAPIGALWTRSRKIAEEALDGRVFAPIGHATSYHADHVLPYWADSLDKTVQIGRHIFYRLPGTYGEGRSFFQRYAGAEPQLPVPHPPTELPARSETAALASALIGDDLHGSGPNVEKAAEPTAVLLADADRPTLLVDRAAPTAVSHRRQSANECAARDGKQLTPLGANDMRSVASSSGC